MKKTLLLYLTLLLAMPAAQAQFYNDGAITNNGGAISDWQNQWFNTTNGIFNGSNNGGFEHHGPSAQTFVNNGSFTALSGHTDYFMGPLGVAGHQEISGSVRPFFYNLNFQNGASSLINLTNTDGANVGNLLTFSNGITTTIRNNHQAGALRFSGGAGYSGGNTDAQHVNGYVSKIGNDAFTFPVGDGTDIRTVSIPATLGTNEISVAWFAGNPSLVTDPSDGSVHSTTSAAAPLLPVSNTGFWDWVLVAGDDDGMAVTVSIPDVSSYATTAGLRLAGWNGTQWIDLSGASTASGNTENSTLSGVIPAGTPITALAIGSTSFALPVHFISFTLSSSDCKITARWSTASETDNAYFQVERSRNGVDFTIITTIPGAGTSGLVHNYEFADMNAVKGNNHYRIRQVDVNGHSSLTAIKTAMAHCGSPTIVKLYPTISKSMIIVELPDGYEKAQVQLLDMTGRPLTVKMGVNSTQRVIYLNGLPAATYLVRIMNAGDAQVFKVVKQ